MRPRRRPAVGHLQPRQDSAGTRHGRDPDEHPDAGQPVPAGGREGHRAVAIRRYQSVKDFLTAVEQAVEAPATQWETPAEAAKKLIELVRDPHGYESLATFLTWAERLDEDSFEDMHALADVMPFLKSSSIAALLDNDEDASLRIYRRFTDHLMRAGFPWADCDGLAEVCKCVVRETGDHTVLRQTLAALAELGRSHNRWHVRDVLTEMLQGIREPESALAALEGLRDAGISAVQWSLENFTIRSLHLNLRGGIEAILKADDED